MSGTRLVIDLRSDTVTLPTDEMRQAMATARVGDDVFGEDPTVQELEKIAAEMFGKEASLFVPSGTMGNLICALTHCWERGSLMYVGDQSHMLNWEQGGVAQFGGIIPRSLATRADGTFDVNELLHIYRDGSNYHHPTPRLVAVENPINGKVLPLSFMQEGLGAPVGTVVVGSTEFIHRARRMRKALGGGMRQCGILAAAGIIALTKMMDRLQDDHNNARKFAKGLMEYGNKIFDVNVEDIQTNILFFNVKDSVKCTAADFVKMMSEPMKTNTTNVRVLSLSNASVRAVFHNGISAKDVDAALEKLKIVCNEIQNMN